MAREKKPVHKVRMTEGKRNIFHQLLEEYDKWNSEIQKLLRWRLNFHIPNNGNHVYKILIQGFVTYDTNNKN